MKGRKKWLLALLVIFMVSTTAPSCTSFLQALNDSQTNNQKNKTNDNNNTNNNTNDPNKTSKGKKN